MWGSTSYIKIGSKTKIKRRLFFLFCASFLASRGVVLGQPVFSEPVDGLRPAVSEGQQWLVIEVGFRGGDVEVPTFDGSKEEEEEEEEEKLMKEIYFKIVN